MPHTVAGGSQESPHHMELMGLATSMGNLLPELPVSPFDNDSLVAAYPLKGGQGGGHGGGRDSGGGAADLGVDADCIFACDDDENSDPGHDHSGADDMPFAWAQPQADMFEFSPSISSKSDGSADAVNGGAMQSFIAQQCMTPPVLASFSQSYSYGRPHESVSRVLICLCVAC